MAPSPELARHAPAAARAAGLRYASDARPGIARVKRGRVFVYVRDGRIVRDAETLARIRRLAVPPAWTDVWISPDAEGHLQATGRDARGRKQYRYHPRWREARDETKYHRMLAFAKALPRIRARVAKDLRRKGLPRDKVLAAIVRLLDTAYMRVGNDEYRRANGSHGLTTLQDRHAKVSRDRVRFTFTGKSGKRHEVDIEDPALARIVGRCRDLPGQELFQYVDEAGGVRDVTSGDVNAYIREAAGDAFTAKDFRTWAGTVLAAVALRDVQRYGSAAQAKRNVIRAIESVAKRLGNTPAVCRKCYVHPEVLEAYLDGTFDEIRASAKGRRRPRGALGVDEALVLRILRRRLAAAKDPRRLEKELAASIQAARRARGQRRR